MKLMLFVTVSLVYTHHEQSVRDWLSRVPMMKLNCVASLLFLDKCLAPYYGGCDYTRECQSSRLEVNCGPCLENFNLVSIPGEEACASMCMECYIVYSNLNSVAMEWGILCRELNCRWQADGYNLCKCVCVFQLF